VIGTVCWVTGRAFVCPVEETQGIHPLKTATVTVKGLLLEYVEEENQSAIFWPSFTWLLAVNMVYVHVNCR